MPVRPRPPRDRAASPLPVVVPVVVLAGLGAAGTLVLWALSGAPRVPLVAAAAAPVLPLVATGAVVVLGGLGFPHHRLLRGTAPGDWQARGQTHVARNRTVRSAVAFPDRW